jgi:uncharacterized protein
MKLQSALILAVLVVACPAMAQTSSRDMKGGMAQPAQPAKPAQPATAPATPAPAAEKPDPAKLAAIRHLMEITNTAKMGDDLSNGITTQVRGAVSRGIPPDQMQKFMDAFLQKFSAAAPSSAVNDNTAAVYAKHFSMEDIEALTKFYESPVGQRVLKSLPEAQEEAYSSGQQIDRQAALQVLWGMADEYTQLKQMLPPDPSKPEAKPAGAPPAAATPAPGAGSAAKPAPAPAPATAPEPAPKPAPAPPQQ